MTNLFKALSVYIISLMLTFFVFYQTGWYSFTTLPTELVFLRMFFLSIGLTIIFAFINMLIKVIRARENRAEKTKTYTIKILKVLGAYLISSILMLIIFNAMDWYHFFDRPSELVYFRMFLVSVCLSVILMSLYVVIHAIRNHERRIFS